MPENSQSIEARSKLRQEAFRDAEASVLIEGLDPTTDARYLAIKAQLIAGTISFDDAETALNAQYGGSIPVDEVAAISA